MSDDTGGEGSHMGVASLSKLLFGFLSVLIFTKLILTKLSPEQALCFNEF